MSCNRNGQFNRTFKEIIDYKNNIITVGAQDNIRRQGNYDAIWTYEIDKAGNVYVSNSNYYSIDKFDKNGCYLFSIGGIRHVAMNYPGWIERFTIDSNENIIAYSNAPKQRFIKISPDGKDLKEYPINPELKHADIRKIKILPGGGLLLLAIVQENENSRFRLIRYEPETGKYQVIHIYNNTTGMLPSFISITPPFCVDAQGNIYAGDNIKYGVIKYSPEGKPVDRFFKDIPSNPIENSDGNYLTEPFRIRRIPNFDAAQIQLKDGKGFLPALFSIEIDNEKIFLWTSSQNLERKFIIDVYDLKWNYLYSISYYNFLPDNMVFIRDGKFYAPKMGCDDQEYKNMIGRLSVLNIPTQIEIFQLKN